MPITKKELIEKLSDVPDSIYAEIDTTLEKRWDGASNCCVTVESLNRVQIYTILSVYRAAGWTVEYNQHQDNGQGRDWNSFDFS